VKTLLREPLLHFLLLGAAIFVAYSLLPKRIGDEPTEIVITQGQIASTIVGFTRTWQRPPTNEELEGLIRDRVREEIYYREALALGLDKDDTIVRRRLRQKLEFLTDDIATQIQPTDDDLTAYLKAHGERFGAKRRWTFSQVYFNPQNHGDSLEEGTARTLAQLSGAGGDADLSAEGDPFLLEHNFTATPVSEIAKLFGERFATRLATLPPGKWLGPIESGYGIHLVFIREITEVGIPALPEVRGAVAREWADARRREANEKRYEAMLKGYVVVIENVVEKQGQPVAKAK
jgi:PPIC-type PPIASE domain